MLKSSIQAPAGAGRGLDLKGLRFRTLEDKVGRDEAEVAHRSRKSIVPLWIHSVENIYEISVERCQVGYTISGKKCGQEAETPG